jgi:hypothetical protein
VHMYPKVCEDYRQRARGVTHTPAGATMVVAACWYCTAPNWCKKSASTIVWGLQCSNLGLQYVCMQNTDVRLMCLHRGLSRHRFWIYARPGLET